MILPNNSRNALNAIFNSRNCRATGLQLQDALKLKDVQEFAEAMNPLLSARYVETDAVSNSEEALKTAHFWILPSANDAVKNVLKFQPFQIKP